MNQEHRTALYIYAIGYLIAAITYSIWGHEYMHAPAPYHLVILLIFIMGVILFLVSIIRYGLNKSESQLSYAIVNGAHTGLYLIYIFSAL